MYCFQETVQWSSPPSTLIIPVCSGCKSFLSCYSEKEDCGQFLCLRIWYRNHSSGVDNFSLVPFSLQTKAEGQSKLWIAFWSWFFCQDIHVDDCFNDTGLNRDWSEVVSYLKSSCTRLLNIAMQHGTGEWPNVYQVGWPRLITVMGIGAFLEVETFSGP